MTEEGKVPAHFILYKGKTKNRTSLTINKKRRRYSSKSRRYSKSHKEPWLLATSLSKASLKPELIINIYRQRMRIEENIEENIKDTKCPHYGLGFTRCFNRMNILLLIAAIATFAAWLAGLHTKLIGKAADFQAHSAKFNSALSNVFLGRRVLKRKLHMSQEQFQYAL